MSVLTITNLAQYYGQYSVFTGLGASIPQGAKIGLVGPNGVGKTTLLRILAGEQTPTAGSVTRARAVRLGYLRQEAGEVFAGRTHTVYEEMLSVFDALRAQGARLQETEARMAAGTLAEGEWEAYGRLQEAFERAGGYDYEMRIGQVLRGVGFSADDGTLPVSHLSGGQKTRALLARLLLESPDLLILDEPTNHLDTQALEWLEGTLQAWPGALLVVSHDRYFLDRVVDRIWEMGPTSIEVYRGNYSAYVQQRADRWAQAEQLYETERARLDKELEFIRKNIEGQAVDIARGKLKRISRELVAIAELGLLGVQGKSWMETGVGGVRMMTVDEAARAIKAIPRPAGRPPAINLRLKAAGRSGNLVLRTQGLVVGYPGNRLFAAADITLERLECAALIGPNGAGKTTFLRTILDRLDPLAGTVQPGASLQIGYFAQTQEALDPALSVLDTLLAHRNLPIGEARNLLAGFLFRGEDVFKPVSALSGGEKARLALAILLLDQVNFLVLDEPTNHLDIPAQEVLQAALETFGGTVLLVSHDRYLIDRLATQIWEVRAGRLDVFAGPYQEYLAARDAEAQRAKDAAAGPTRHAAAPTTSAAQADKQVDKQAAKVARQRIEHVAALEAHIAALEAALAACHRQLEAASAAGRVGEIADLGRQYTATQAKIDALLGEWEAVATG